MEEIMGRIQSVFRRVFGDPGLSITSETRAGDLEGWDSLGHVQIIVEVEREFNLRFRLAELNDLGSVDRILRLVASRLEAEPARA
jgi:acyl carrier protein